ITNGEANGEHKVLAFLRSRPETVNYDSVIDVGANVGDWTAEALRHFGDTRFSNFYCVEPIQKFSTRIRERFSQEPRVKVLELALSASGSQPRMIFEVGGGGTMYQTYRGQLKAGAKSSATFSNEQTAKKTMIEHIVESSSGDALF